MFLHTYTLCFKSQGFLDQISLCFFVFHVLSLVIVLIVVSYIHHVWKTLRFVLWLLAFRWLVLRQELDLTSLGVSAPYEPENAQGDGN